MFKISIVSIIFCYFICGIIAYVDENSNGTLISYICDDELLRGMEKRLNQMTLANEMFETKLDFMRLKLEHQDIERNTVIINELKKFETILSTIPTKSVAPSKLPQDCAEAVPSGGHSGIYLIQLNPNSKPFLVYCEVDPDGGDAWTIVQRRQDGTIDFFRNWSEYKTGFGNMAGEFFIGLDKLHDLTHTSVQELWIKMEDFASEKRFARYNAFAIGDEAQLYALTVLGSFTGDADDSMRGQQGHKFSTKDKDNDVWGQNCAVSFHGAWWYAACHRSNLNGEYLRGEYPKDKFAQGIDWDSWHGHYYSLKYVHMAIRRRKNA